MKYKTHAARERVFFWLCLSSADTLSNESMAFPVNTVCLLQSLRASRRPIRAIDLLHTFSLARASAEISSKKIGFTPLPSLGSAHAAPSPSVSTLRLPPFIQTCTAVAELHIERMRGLASWSCESHLNRCSSWADTQTSPRESVLSLRQERGESRSRQWCDKLRFLIFHSADLFFPSTALPPINTPQPSATPPLCSHLVCAWWRKAYSHGNEGG